MDTWLVGRDLIDGVDRWLGIDELDACFAAAGITAPPETVQRRLGAIDRLEAVIGTSHFGNEPMEGVIVRPIDGEAPRVSKLVRLGFVRLDEASWANGIGVLKVPPTPRSATSRRPPVPSSHTRSRGPSQSTAKSSTNSATPAPPGAGQAEVTCHLNEWH